MYGIIYKVTNIINNKCYIGQTIQTMKMRKSSHLHRAFKEKATTKFYNALRKYGKDSFVWEEIDYGMDAIDLDEKEIYHIYQHDSKEKGYNILAGGECSGRLDGDAMAKIGGSKPFYAFNSKGILIGEFINKRRFEREYGVPSQRITEILKGVGFSSKGYTFILKEEYSQQLLNKRLDNMIVKREFRVINKKTKEEVGIFSNQKECKKILDLPANTHIGEVLKGTRTSSQGYLFEYTE